MSQSINIFTFVPLQTDLKKNFYFRLILQALKACDNFKKPFKYSESFHGVKMQNSE